MYTQINGPCGIEIYDSENNKRVGNATFMLTSEAEQDLLQLVNNGVKPTSMTVLNIDLYEPEKDYVLVTAYNTYKREGTIHASVEDPYTGKSIPIAIQMKYDARVRGKLSGEDSYYFDSADLDNIVIESVKIYY